MSHDLGLQRRFDAAPEVVFDPFTDPDAGWPGILDGLGRVAAARTSGAR